MKFIADVMLGRLAKRMRLLGFDVLYDRTISDNEIIRLSLEQDRVILTRDTGLAERPLASNRLFIKNDNVREQLMQVLASLPRSPFSVPFTRCSQCNQILVLITKQDVKDLVPRYVYENNDEFLQCPKCERIYWKGTQVNRMGIHSGKKKK